MAGSFRVAMDWEPLRRLPSGLHVPRWLTRQVRPGGCARFRCDAAGVELYVDHSGLVELRDINDSAKVLYRRLGKDDPAGRQR